MSFYRLPLPDARPWHSFSAPAARFHLEKASSGLRKHEAWHVVTRQSLKQQRAEMLELIESSNSLAPKAFKGLESRVSCCFRWIQHLQQERWEHQAQMVEALERIQQLEARFVRVCELEVHCNLGSRKLASRRITCRNRRYRLWDHRVGRISIGFWLHKAVLLKCQAESKEALQRNELQAAALPLVPCKSSCFVEAFRVCDRFSDGEKGRIDVSKARSCRCELRTGASGGEEPAGHRA